jgi:hypothetical protein
MREPSLIKILGLMISGIPLNSEEADPATNASATCLMARSVKVLQRPSSSSSEGESDENLTPSYSKLANISTRQQTTMERIKNLLDKSNDLLNDEMDRSQALTDELKSL